MIQKDIFKIGLILGITLQLFFSINSNKLISSKDAKKMLNQNKIDIILDVRSNEEYSNGHYPNAINVPYDLINEKNTNNFDKRKNILIYCRSGRRAKIAADKLSSLGFKKIYYLEDSYQSI